jgi:hypothetical protein
MRGEASASRLPSTEALVDAVKTDDEAVKMANDTELGLAVRARSSRAIAPLGLGGTR